MKERSTLKRELNFFSLMLIVPLGGLALMSGFFLWFLIVPHLNERLDYDTRYITEHLSKELKHAVASGDVAATRTACAELLQDPNFFGVAVFTNSDELIFSSHKDFAGAAENIITKPSLRAHSSPSFIARWRAIEVDGVRRGKVVVAVSKARVRVVERWLMSCCCAIVFFVAGALFWSSRFSARFRSPIDDVSHFASRVGDGHFHSRLDSSGVPIDFFWLMENLNRMAEEIEAQQSAAIKAREEALQASELKSRFLANMSHEMRTPLNGILGISELLIDSNTEYRLKQDLETIQSSAYSLADIIQDVLDISKIEAGELRVERVECRLSAVVRNAMFSLTPFTRKKGVRLRAYLASDVPERIISDPLRFRQILLNLLSNAVKFTQCGAVDLYLTTFLGDLVVEVRDEGIGLTTGQLSTIFLPFRQADVSTTRKYGGTGLGLSISSSLAERLGGSLLATSILGQGSSFFLKVPLVRGQPPAWKAPIDVAVLGRSSWADDLYWRLREGGMNLVLPSQASVLIAGADDDESVRAIESELEEISMEGRYFIGVVHPDRTGNDSPFDRLNPWRVVSEPFFVEDLHALLERNHEEAPKSEPIAEVRPRILVAEDNQTNQKVISRMLSRLGYEPFVVENGEEAVEAILGAKDYALVFMDLQMPVMDGIEATARIRHAGSRVPIIACTADAMAGAWPTCKSSGMNGYISKPIRIDVLKMTLDKFSAETV